MPPNCSILTTAVIGSTDGVAVGAAVGSMVGWRVGGEVGPADEAAEGTADGAGVLLAPGLDAGRALQATSVRRPIRPKVELSRGVTWVMRVQTRSALFGSRSLLAGQP